jgi:hypothetical protein
MPTNLTKRKEVRRGLHGATIHVPRQRVQSPASPRSASELATPITRRNEDAG